MKNLYQLKKYFLQYKAKLLWGIVFILISNAGTVYIPIIIKDAINALNKNVSSDVLLRYAVIVIITSAIAGFFRFLIRQTIIVVSREIEYDLRGDFWNHIQNLPMKYFQNNSTGSIMALATNDINAVRMFIGPAVMYSIDTGLRLIYVIFIMLSISPALTFYSLIPLPFLSFLVYYVGQKVHIRFTAIQEKFSELTTKAQENFSGIRVIKSYVREENEIADFHRLSKEYLKKNMSLVKVQALFQPTLFLLTGTSVIIVVFAGGLKVIAGQLMIGDITAMVMYLGILIWPMIAFGWVINIIQQAEASMKRLNRIFSEPLEITDSAETDTAITEIHGNLEFRDVSFIYREGLAPALSNISFSVPAGSSIAIMGHTGSGKTSLINLIPRLYDITSGSLLIDGKPIRSIPLSVLRKSIGFVPQEPFLFSDTIMNNLIYGSPEATEEQALAAARAARFHNDVQDFPEGYNTIIGERGITLSGGQKQRATLARALVLNPRILILDDSFSAVDTHTEEEILKNLREFMKGRTSILISHRVSTVQNADRILVLENGKIAEAGSHNELLALNGIYAGIYYKQLLEKELEEL
ncbi:MAG: ABC transporter ATP-binding protein/permease [Ignavibacteria bacterium]|nr:ABC transporter ATP-binding protein/permease [Ignavibacteria bacterium]